MKRIADCGFRIADFTKEEELPGCELVLMRELSEEEIRNLQFPSVLSESEQEISDCGLNMEGEFRDCDL